MEQLPLRDIHLPEPVSWWPPAPGWIALTVLIPLLVFIVHHVYKRLRQKTAFKTAGKMLAAIRNDKSQDCLQTVAALSTLLRRVAVSTAPRQDVASLSGAAWLAYLDASLPDSPFSQGVGRCLGDVQYRRSVPEEFDREELLRLCERWIKVQKKPPVALGFLGRRKSRGDQ